MPSRLDQLKRNDLFTVGGRKQVWRVMKPTGSFSALVYKVGASERILYEARHDSRETSDVSVYQTTGGAATRVGPTVVKPGIMSIVGTWDEDAPAVKPAKVPSVARTTRTESRMIDGVVMAAVGTESRTFFRAFPDRIKVLSREQILRLWQTEPESFHRRTS